MIRVFLLDDHGLMRAGYRMMLEPHADIEVVGEASSGDERRRRAISTSAPSRTAERAT